MVGIRIQSETLSALKEHLRAAEPEETGAFALLGAVRPRTREADLVVRTLVLPQSEDWESKGNDWLTPSTAYTNRAAIAAERAGLGLAFVHSHPSPDHPAGLSWIDERSTRVLFANLRGILGPVPLASLVFTPTTFAGVCRVDSDDPTDAPVDRLRVIGDRLQTTWAADAVERPTGASRSGTYERQVLALGDEGQNSLGRMRIGIVGAGGTGSAVGEQLARMGVRRFILIDDDRLAPSNVTRVYGSTPWQGRRRKLKVEVLARHLKKVARGVEVDAHPQSVNSVGGFEPLLDADLVFGCTDTDGSRATLNDLAMRYLVPVVDLGCRIDVAGGRIRGEYGRVRYLRPGLPCLWCTSTIDGTKILQESLSLEERSRLAESGYGSGVGPQPSVIHLTTLVASLGVSEFLTITLGVPSDHDGCWASVSLGDPFLRRVQSATDPSCRCQTLIGLGAEGRPVR